MQSYISCMALKALVYLETCRDLRSDGIMHVCIYEWMPLVL